jgi:hypothetical protein
MLRMKYRDREMFMGLDYGDEVWSTISRYVPEYDVDDGIRYGKLRAVFSMARLKHIETFGISLCPALILVCPGLLLSGHDSLGSSLPA